MSTTETRAHPLDPLTPPEIERAVAIIRADRELPASTRFVSMSVAEPPRHAVDPPRGAEAVLYDAPSRTTTELRVDLDAGAVVHRNARDDVRPQLTVEDFLADVRREIWQPPKAQAPNESAPEPTFHEFASEWFETKRHEFAPRTREDYELSLTRHLLPFFKDHLLSEITAQEADRYKAAKVCEREKRLVERPLSNRTINKTLTRLGQILDAAVRYDLLPFNPVKGRVEKLKETAPKRALATP